jgi:hypothetical protein
MNDLLRYSEGFDMIVLRPRCHGYSTLKKVAHSPERAVSVGASRKGWLKSDSTRGELAPIFPKNDFEAANLPA